MNIITSNTILYCKKWEETVAFYKNVLRFDVHFSNGWLVEFIVNTKARLSIANQERTSIKSSNGSGITVCLQIDDAELMHKYLQEWGAHPTPLRDLWASRVFYVLDPEGNRLEFWS